jgi:hypothetical protein
MGTELTTAPKAPAAIPLHRVAVDVADLLSGAIGALREQAESEGTDTTVPASLRRRLPGSSSAERSRAMRRASVS